MKKLVEIVKNETIECIKVVDPKLARKLAALEKKLNECADADCSPIKCIEMSFFAVFGMFIDELVIIKEMDGIDSVQYSVTFTYCSIDAIIIHINFSKN